MFRTLKQRRSVTAGKGKIPRRKRQCKGLFNMALRLT